MRESFTGTDFWTCGHSALKRWELKQPAASQCRRNSVSEPAMGGRSGLRVEKW